MNYDANTAQHQKTTRFREFPLDDEHTLYVGKTAADNDELTLRFAKPNDYWFHARGVPGSHAVLRSPSKDKKPPKNIIEQAAAIAAYFSKARNAKMSPVAYTQKKYIRKPKGAAVGAVILEREEVLMVRPHVPAGLVGAENDE
jgi:predicted ribosome quality control (RQC) complex YloA/Tae2 family protein